MADTLLHGWKLLYEAGRQALQARKLQEAEQSFSAALQLAEDFAAGDPRLAATLNALARIYSLQGRYLAAAALLNRLLEVTERTLGPGHVQVAGVLTNLAEMYTHLGAAREELELRERVLGIRADDPNAEPTALQRLRDRVVELRSTIAAQDPPTTTDADEFELVPSARGPQRAEQSVPAIELEAVVAAETAIEVENTVEAEPAAIERVAVAERAVEQVARRVERPTAMFEAGYRTPAAAPLSISPLSVAPWPGAAATGTTPSGGRSVEMDRPALRPFAEMQSSALIEYERAPEPALALVLAGDHGMVDLSRDSSQLTLKRRPRSRSSIFSIAAGIALVSAVLAARGYVKGSEDERVSDGSVNLANAAAAVAVPLGQSTPTLEPRTVEHVMAELRAEREGKRISDTNREPARAESRRWAEMVAERTPRAPSAAEMERALRGLDGAVRAIDQRTRAATESATVIRVQAPTFKNGRMADLHGSRLP